MNNVGPHPAHVLTATAWPKGQNSPTGLAVRARAGLGAAAVGGTVGSRHWSRLGEHKGATGEARGKVSGRGSHQSDDSSMGWQKAAFGDDVPVWRLRAVVDGDPGALLRLREGKETVRHGGNEEEDDRWWRSPIDEDGGEGGSKSIVPGGGFRRRGGQTAMPHHGAGGGVVLFGRHRAVKGKAKEACDDLTVEAEIEKKRGSGG
jgi:hypothetical protein